MPKNKPRVQARGNRERIRIKHTEATMPTAAPNRHIPHISITSIVSVLLAISARAGEFGEFGASAGRLPCVKILSQPVSYFRIEHFAIFVRKKYQF